MSADTFLDNYDGQSTAELIALAATHRIDSIVLAFESAITAKKESGKSLSGPETVVLAIEAMEREVNNGGFSQFFYNSSVEFAPILVESLQKIACPEAADLAARAIACLNLESLDPDSIEERMDPDDDQLETALDEIDGLYYADVGDVSNQLFQFITTHKSEISIP